MNLKEAYEKAKSMIDDSLEITGCIDIGDSYVFATNPKGMEETAPGGLFIQAMKKSNLIGYFDNSPNPHKIDPYENIKRLIKGKELELPE